MCKEGKTVLECYWSCWLCGTILRPVFDDPIIYICALCIVLTSADGVLSKMEGLGLIEVSGEAEFQQSPKKDTLHTWQQLRAWR